jgi:hypothetical protein
MNMTPTRKTVTNLKLQDLEQIEEWNEYGELKDQIASTQDFGTFKPSTIATPATTAATTLAPEAAATSTASTPQRSGPPSRASSETRHISIEEPADREKDKAGDSKPSSSQKSTESPMNIAIRQLGAEAAAKAAQKKGGAAAQSSKAAAPSTDEKKVLEQATPSAAARLSTEAAIDSGDGAAEVTATKTPAQLASEGASKASIDKIAESEDKLVSGAAELDNPKSTEQQQLELRRTSSITQTKSRLSEATPVAESDTVAAASKTTSPSSSISAPGWQAEVDAKPTPAPRKHRGSDVGEASIEEIRALEQKLAIPEEDESEAQAEEVKPEAEAVTKAPALNPVDETEDKITEGMDTQKTDPKDAEKAAESVGD